MFPAVCDSTFLPYLPTYQYPSYAPQMPRNSNVLVTYRRDLYIKKKKELDKRSERASLDGWTACELNRT